MHETLSNIDWTDLATQVGALQQGQEIGSSDLDLRRGAVELLRAIADHRTLP